MSLFNSLQLYQEETDEGMRQINRTKKGGGIYKIQLNVGVVQWHVNDKIFDLLFFLFFKDFLVHFPAPFNALQVTGDTLQIKTVLSNL